MTRDEALDAIAYGEACAEVLRSRPWKAIAHRKGQIARAMLAGQNDATRLSLLRAQFDELAAVQRMLKSGIAEGEVASAMLATENDG